MTNEMQWGVAMGMLREIAENGHDEWRWDQFGIVARVRSAYDILRKLDVDRGECEYDPDRDDNLQG